MPAEVADLRAANQEALVALSGDSRQFHAAGSSHFPQLSEPTVIVEAVRWIIGRRSNSEPEPVVTDDDELQRTTSRPGSGA